MSVLTRIKNNQITDGTIWANAKIIPGSIVGSLFSSNITVTSDFVITGNLTVQGASTYLTVASTNTYVNDPLIVLNNAFTGANSYDLGFIFNRGSSPNKAFYWDESSGEFRLITTTETGTTYGSIAAETNFEKLRLGNLVAQYDVSTITLTATGLINTTGNISAAAINTGTLNLTGFFNSSGNISAAVLNGGAINSTGLINTTGNISAATVIAGQFNTTGNLSASQVSTATLNATGLINTLGNLSASQVSTATLNATGLINTLGNISGAVLNSGAINSTGLINTTGNVSAATVIAGQFNTTGNLSASQVSTATLNATGFINTLANVSAAVVNTGALNATGTTTLAAVNSTGFINTTGNISGAVVNTGALNATGTTTLVAVNSTGFINTTGNISGAVVNTGALNATGTTTLVAVNSTGFINTTANISAAIINTGALNSTGLINTTANVSAAVVNAGQFNTTGNLSASQVSTATLKASGLTSGRVVFTSTGGLLVDNAGITFTANTLTVGGAKPVAIDGTAGSIGTTLANLILNTNYYVDLNSKQISNLLDPSSNQDAATKNYVDSQLSGVVAEQIIVGDTEVTITDTGTDGTITAKADGATVAVITSSLTDFKIDTKVSATTASTTTTSGALQVVGGVGIGGNITVGGNIKSTDVTQSTSSTTGAIITAGGAGIAKNLWVGGAATIVGNLTVQGVLTAIQSSTLEVTDAQLTLAKGAGSSAAADGAGINVDYGNVGANITYTHATTSWNFNRAVIGSTYANFGGNVLATNFVGGGVNVSGNLLAASAVLGSLTVNGVVTNQSVNASGNILATGGIFNALTVNGSQTVTGLITTAGINSSANILATGAVLNALTVNGSQTVTGLITTAGINSSANVLATSGIFNALTVNGTAGVTTLNATTLTATGNIIAGLAQFAAINSTPIGNATPSTGVFTTATAGAVNAPFIGNTGAVFSGASLNVTGNVLSTGGIFNALTVNGTAGVTTLNATTLTATGNVIGGLGQFAAINATPIGNATASTGAFTSLSATGILYANATTASTSTGTGALIVAGGAGIASNLSLGGAINIGGSGGTSGQYLQSTGTGLQWVTLSTGAAIVSGASNVTVTANYVNVAVNGTNVATFSSTGLNGAAIGASTSSTGKFTTLQATSTVTFDNYTGYVKSAGAGGLSASGSIPSSDVSGLGDLATQNGSSITITGGTIDGASIGSTTASTGKFTTLEATQTGLFNSAQGANTFTIKGVSDAALFLAVPSTTGGRDAVVISGAGNTSPTFGVAAKFGGTGGIQIPFGSSAQRPGSAGNVDLVGMMRYNTTTNNLEFCTVAGAPGTYTAAGSQFTTIATNAFSGNGSQTVFTLSSSSTTAGTIVMVNGVVQIPTTAYSVTGTSLAFTEAPATGDAIDARVITTTATVSSLASGNGYNTFDVSTVPYANITAGTSSATVRVSVDGVTGTATFTNDVVINGNLTVKGGSSGNINIGDQDTDKVQLVGEIVFDQASPIQVTNTNLTQIDSFPVAAYSSAIYEVQVKQVGGSQANVSFYKAHVVQDTINSYITTYGIVNTGNAMGSLSSNVVSGTTRLWYTPVAGQAIANVKVKTTYIV